MTGKRSLPDRPRTVGHVPRDALARVQERVAAILRTPRTGAESGPAREAPRRPSTPVQSRPATAVRGDRAAQARDLNAAARDRDAKDRDDAAEQTDRAAEACERDLAEGSDLEDASPAWAAVRARGASARRHSARERVAAAHDRAAASADRQQAAGDRQAAGLDELTGVLRRGAGEQALLREIERAHRWGRPLTVAVLDVDALKAVNDRHGRAAGDALLREVATAISATMRAYDLAIRWGGDEFVCVLSDATIEVAADRVADARCALAARRPGAAISVGIAAFEDADSLESVVARADADLYRAKARRQADSPAPGAGATTRLA